MSAVTANSSASTPNTLRRCCRRVCRGAQAFVVGGLVTSTPTEDVRTRTPWTSGGTYVITVRLGWAPSGCRSCQAVEAFRTGSACHRHVVFPNAVFRRRAFPKHSRWVDRVLVQGFRRKTLRAPDFGLLPNVQARHDTFEFRTLLLRFTTENGKNFVKLYAYTTRLSYNIRRIIKIFEKLFPFKHPFFTRCTCFYSLNIYIFLIPFVYAQVCKI